MKLTGCAVPCNYFKYDAVEVNNKWYNVPKGLRLMLASDELVEETEVYVYDNISLISEIGGK